MTASGTAKVLDLLKREAANTLLDELLQGSPGNELLTAAQAPEEEPGDAP